MLPNFGLPGKRADNTECLKTICPPLHHTPAPDASVRDWELSLVPGGLWMPTLGHARPWKNRRIHRHCLPSQDVTWIEHTGVRPYYVIYPPLGVRWASLSPDEENPGQSQQPVNGKNPASSFQPVLFPL